MNPKKPKGIRTQDPGGLRKRAIEIADDIDAINSLSPVQGTPILGWFNDRLTVVALMYRGYGTWWIRPPW